MEEFLRSPAGTVCFFLASVGPFLLSGLSSITSWRPGLIVLGELLLAGLACLAWWVGNFLSCWVLAFLFLNSLGMIAVGWWKQKRGMPMQS